MNVIGNPLLAPAPGKAQNRSMQKDSLRAYSAIIPVPFGCLGLRSDAGALLEIVFLPPGTPLRAPADSACMVANLQINAYLENPEHRFALPCRTSGSPFRRRVWDAIAAIPCGETRSYGDLAHDLCSAPRAIGQACGDNPFPIIVPCHRVRGKQGLGGFSHSSADYLLDAKCWLLRHEGAQLL